MAKTLAVIAILALVVWFYVWKDDLCTKHGGTSQATGRGFTVCIAADGTIIPDRKIYDR